MAKIINITDKLNNEKPKIVIGDNEFEVNDSMEIVLKFEELSNEGSVEALTEALKITLGEKIIEHLDVKNMRIENFKVLIIAIMAAVQNIEYEEAEARFRTFKGQ